MRTDWSPPTSPSVQRWLFRTDEHGAAVPLKPGARIRVGDVVTVELHVEPAMSGRWPPHTPVLVDEPGVGALVPLGPASSGGGPVPTLATSQGHRVFVAELGPGPLLSYRARAAFAGTFGWPGVRAWVNQDARAQLEGAGMALGTEPAR